jgi:hypothetical protein
MHLRLKNTGALHLHGRHPGEEWTVETGPDGRASDALWRKRLADEEKYSVGVVAIVGTEAGPVNAEPPAHVIGQADLGPILTVCDALDKRVADAELRAKQAEQRSAALDQRFATLSTDVQSRLSTLEKILREAAG